MSAAWLLQNALVATAVALVLLAVLRFWRPAPWVEHLLWTALAVKFILPPVAQVPLPLGGDLPAPIGIALLPSPAPASVPVALPELRSPPGAPAEAVPTATRPVPDGQPDTVAGTAGGGTGAHGWTARAGLMLGLLWMSTGTAALLLHVRTHVRWRRGRRPRQAPRRFSALVADVAADLAMRPPDDVATGRRAGPHLVVAGPMLEAPATLVRIAEKRTNEPWHRTRVPVPGPATAAAIVDSVVALGVDFIKVRETVDLDTYRALARAARARRIPLAGHAPFGMAVIEGARLGLATFEHASYPYPLDTVPAARREVLRAFREGGTALVPTMVAWSGSLMHPDSLRALIADSAGVRDPRRALLAAGLVEQWGYDLEGRNVMTAASLRGWCGFVNRTLADLAAMHAAGIPVLPGSDLAGPGLVPGWSLHDELEILVDGGVMTAAEALRAATALAARHAGMGQIVGTVEAGRRADLLVLRADPTADIRALRGIEAVILNGGLLETTRLSALRGGVPLEDRAGVDLLPGVREAGCEVIARRP